MECLHDHGKVLILVSIHRAPNFGTQNELIALANRLTIITYSVSVIIYRLSLILI